MKHSLCEHLVVPVLEGTVLVIRVAFLVIAHPLATYLVNLIIVLHKPPLFDFFPELSKATPSVK